MTIHATLTVDLNGYVSDHARKVFNQSLADLHYKKHKLTTLWTVHFVPSASKADADLSVREHVANAAKAAGITNYEVLVMFGDQPAVEWKKTGSTDGLDGLLAALQRLQ
ncbi:hypothetical protein ACTACH_19805 [Pseudomonas syringae]|uniref:hypothetical protein n=1 Tax=Pseudomonas syringae TaxID=317 RepID=UPI0005C9771F|nr:hypothetical protein [Pseudomonas syringae]